MFEFECLKPIYHNKKKPIISKKESSEGGGLLHGRSLNGIGRTAKKRLPVLYWHHALQIHRFD